VSNNHHQTPAAATVIDPEALVLERSVIGALLFDPYLSAELRAHLDADLWFLVRHRHLYEVYERLVAETTDVDEMLLAVAMRAAGYGDDLADGYLSGLLMESAALLSLDKARVAIGLLRAAAQRRALAATVAEIGAQLNDRAVSTPMVLENAKKAILDATEDRRAPPPATAAVIASQLFDEANARRVDPTARSFGLPTGIRLLDDLAGGIPVGYLSGIAVPPKGGKSLMLINIAANIALWLKAQGRPEVVLYLSLEMDKGQQIWRVVSRLAQTTNAQARAPHTSTPEEWRRVGGALGQVADWPLVIDDAGGQTVYDLLATMERVPQQLRRPLGLVVVDYFQRLAPTRRAQEGQAKMEEALGLLENYARRQRIPVLGAITTNQAWEADARLSPDAPRIANHHLFASGAPLRDCYLVAALYYHPDWRNQNKPQHQAHFEIMAHRDGPTGGGPVLWLDKPRMSLYNVAANGTRTACLPPGVTWPGAPMNGGQGPRPPEPTPLETMLGDKAAP
jgi:replicative DNA helicase